MSYVRKRVEVSAEKRERWFIKLSLGVVAGLIVFIAVCWGGRHAYLRWQERRLVLRGNIAYDRGDYRTAVLAAKSALSVKKDSVPAARILAEVGEKTGDKTALDWRRKVAELQPDSASASIELATTAILFHDLTAAERALNNVPETGTHVATFHAARALLAQAKDDRNAAETEWKQAVELAPGDISYRLQLGVLEVRSADGDQRNRGRKQLKELLSNSNVRLAATRALLADAIGTRAPGDEILAFAQQLAAYPEATISEKVAYLDLLHQANDPKFASYLTELENSVSNQPLPLSELLSWMSLQNLNVLALDFVKRLPGDMQKRWPVPLATAGIYARLRDWQNLLAVVRNVTWKEEFLRHAFLARAQRGLDKEPAAQGEWATSLREASPESTRLVSLLTLTSEWKWDRELVEVLWELSKHPDKQHNAVATLYQHYAKTKDTAGLHRVLVRLADLEPENANVQNNLAQISLLLGAQMEDARRTAADIYKKEPHNPAYATTYAYAQLTKGNTTEALKVMKTLTDEQRHEPAISAYYGLCLAAAKDPRARDYLETGRAANLLPEERSLVESALSRL